MSKFTIPVTGPAPLIVPSSVPIATANGFVKSDNVKLNVATSPEQAEAAPQATELFVIRASDELNVELTTVVNPDPGTAAAENAEITSAKHVVGPAAGNLNFGGRGRAHHFFFSGSRFGPRNYNN